MTIVTLARAGSLVGMLRAIMMALVLTLVLAATASARTVKVPDELGSAIPSAAAIDEPVLLPATIDLDYAAGRPIYGEAAGVKKDHYALTLSAAQGCDGANACFLAEFFGTRGAKLGYKSTNVALALGQKGHYQPSHCGASCAPASISWIQKGVRYEIAANALGGRNAFVTWANSAIRAGNRG
jgi:hypothetical protein